MSGGCRLPNFVDRDDRCGRVLTREVLCLVNEDCDGNFSRLLQPRQPRGGAQEGRVSKFPESATPMSATLTSSSPTFTLNALAKLCSPRRALVASALLFLERAESGQD